MSKKLVKFIICNSINIYSIVCLLIYIFYNMAILSLRDVFKMHNVL